MGKNGKKCYFGSTQQSIGFQLNLESSESRDTVMMIKQNRKLNFRVER